MSMCQIHFHLVMVSQGHPHDLVLQISLINNICQLASMVPAGRYSCYLVGILSSW